MTATMVLFTVRLPCVVHSCLVQLLCVVSSCLSLCCPPPNHLVKCPPTPFSSHVLCCPIASHCPLPPCLTFPLLPLVPLSFTSLPCVFDRPLLSCHPLLTHPYQTLPQFDCCIPPLVVPDASSLSIVEDLLLIVVCLP